MSPRQLPSFRPISASVLFACLVTAAVAAASPASSEPGTASSVPPPPPVCWTITGPFTDGRETYFEASNQCEEPRHCQVWVNGHEPPSMVHLESGSTGRIDVGGTEPGDKFSQDCTPIGIVGDQVN
jgi:hypothetical protein